MKKQFEVKLFVPVRISVLGVEADTATEAFLIVEQSIPYEALLGPSQKMDIGSGLCVKYVEFSEDPTICALVNPVKLSGEVDCNAGIWLDGDGLPMTDGKTQTELKAERADLAVRFYGELLMSTESFGQIVETYGDRTLSDLFYLQAAILKGTFIDHHPSESSVMEIARGLPSGKDWIKRIQVVVKTYPDPVLI